jgi:glycosyltransferase involved in cell wall biosynthesis
MFEFYRGLKSRGFEITVLTALPNYPTGQIFKEFRGKREDWDSENGILRANIKPFRKKSAFLRMYTYFSFIKSAKNADLRHFPRGSFDIVISSSPPLFVGIAACDIAKRHNAKLLFDIRDVWPDIAVNLNLLRKNSLVYNLLESVNKRILSQTDRIFVTSCSDMELIAQKDYPREKIHKIPNGASLETFHPLPDDILHAKRKGMNVSDKFIISYSGSFNQGMNDVSTFVPLMEKLNNQKDILLLLIGDGENLGEIQFHAKEKKLQNIRFIPHQDLSELNAFLNISDLALIPRKKLHNGSSGGLPVKMFESWAVEKPVLLAADPGSEERNLLESVNGGVCVDPGNIDALVDTILMLKNDPEKRKQSGLNGRKSVEKNFSREAGLIKLVEVINSLE